jgi:hypothetical protein
LLIHKQMYLCRCLRKAAIHIKQVLKGFTAHQLRVTIAVMMFEMRENERWLMVTQY